MFHRNILPIFYPEDGGGKFLQNVGPYYQTSWCRIPEESNIHKYHSDNLKSGPFFSHRTCIKDYRKFWWGQNQLRGHLCLYSIIWQTISGIGKKARLDAAATLLPREREDREGTRETVYGFVVAERQPLLFEGGALRPYQLDGLDWLKVLCTNKLYFLLQSVCLRFWWQWLSGRDIAPFWGVMSRHPVENY